MAVLAMRFHMRQEDLQPMDQPLEVDADHPIPVGRCDLFDRAGAGDAGIVAEDVDVAEFGKSLSRGVGEGFPVGLRRRPMPIARTPSLRRISTASAQAAASTSAIATFMPRWPKARR